MMYSANNVGGMQTTLMGTDNLNWVQNPPDTGVGNSYNKNNETEIQIAIPMPPGYGHGPLWSVDPATGEPTHMCSGGVQYPPHRMSTQANGPPHSPPRYQMWVAFEHLPEDVTVPLKMLTEWPNAYLQSTLPEANCTALAEQLYPDLDCKFFRFLCLIETLVCSTMDHIVIGIGDTNFVNSDAGEIHSVARHN